MCNISLKRHAIVIIGILLIQIKVSAQRQLFQHQTRNISTPGKNMFVYPNRQQKHFINPKFQTNKIT